MPFRRNEIVSGPRGAQVVIDDPSGNPVELFQPLGEVRYAFSPAILRSSVFSTFPDAFCGSALTKRTLPGTL